MKKTLFPFLLILTIATGLHAQSEFAPQNLLKPKTTGLFTIPPNQTAREAFDNIGAKAGINMVYAPSFKQDAVIALRVDGQDFFDAMKRLAQETKTFWFALNSKTVILTTESQQDHRDFEPLVLKMVYLPNTPAEKILEIANSVRSQPAGRGTFVSLEAKAIVLKMPESAFAATERLIAEATKESLPLRSSSPVAFPENSIPFELISENGKVRRAVPPNQTPMESLLSDASVDSTQPTRAIYEDLAGRAGLNVIFDRNIRERPASRFHVDGLNLLDTLDLLALQTGTTWQPLNESTLYVMDYNQQNIRDMYAFGTKVIFLPERTTTNRLNEVLNVLRTTVGFRGVFQNEERKAIAIRDTHLRIQLAEKIAADLTKDLGKATSVSLLTETSSFYAENGWVLGTAKKARPKLEVKLRNKTTVRVNETTKGAFEALAGLAGLQVVFDKSFKDTPEMRFSAMNVDILDALDLLAWQTRTFWQVVDQHTIRVLPDTQAVRREQEPLVEKTIVPSNITQANGLLNILRTAFGLRNVFLEEKTDNILIKDTEENVEMVEKVVEVLGKGTIQQ